MTGPPPKPLGMSDFFALEAGEYLERLDGLLAASDSPNADELVRLAQPLRGLAAVNDLPPLPDLLEGIERAIAELSRAGIDPPAHVSELFQAGATAIARAAREVAERGRPDPEGPDFRQFAAQLVRFMESEPDVVSIGTLYYSDSGPHIVSRGIPAARPSTLGRLELVSHGDHLRQAADSLERAPSATQRELRAHTLGTTFRALANAGGGVLADRVAQFAIAAREAVASGVAVTSPGAVAAELRRAGDVLARSGSGDEEALAAELDAVTAAIRAVQPGAPGPVLRATPPPPAPAAAAPPTSPPPRADAPVPESADLVGSWTAYQRLSTGGIGPASLDDLLAGPRAATLPHTPGPAAEPAVVDVRTLLYRGGRALERAQELRAAAKQATGDSLRALVDEVCDLVALALEPSPGSTGS